MKKTCERKGWKGEGTKKKEQRKRAAKALAAAGAIAGGTYAYAEPVCFENPPHGEAGHFHWPSDATVHPFLDITLPAVDQPGDYNDPTTVAHPLVRGGTCGRFYSYGVNGLRVQATAQSGYYTFALGLNAGDVIPNPSGICTFYDDPFCFAASGFLHYPGYNYIEEGVAQYLGVTIGGPFCTYYDNCQYGWIGVVRTGAEFEAFAWGFESDPGVPIEAGDCGPDVPAVTGYGMIAMTLGALASGAWIFRKKRPKPEAA